MMMMMSEHNNKNVMLSKEGSQSVVGKSESRFVFCGRLPVGLLSRKSSSSSFFLRAPFSVRARVCVYLPQMLIANYVKKQLLD